MENCHREKEQSINFKANDKHIYLFPCKAKDVVQTLQEDVSMVFLLLPCPSDTWPLSLFPASVPTLARLPRGAVQLWGLQEEAPSNFPFCLATHTLVEAWGMAGSQWICCCSQPPSFLFPSSLFHPLWEHHAGGTVQWFTYAVKDTSTSAAERWVPALSCLSLHQCFCLQQHGSDSLIQTLTACLLTASLWVRSALLCSPCNAVKTSNLSS